MENISSFNNVDEIVVIALIVTDIAVDDSDQLEPRVSAFVTEESNELKIYTGDRLMEKVGNRGCKVISSNDESTRLSWDKDEQIVKVKGAFADMPVHYWPGAYNSAELLMYGGPDEDTLLDQKLLEYSVPYSEVEKVISKFVVQNSVEQERQRLVLKEIDNTKVSSGRKIEDTNYKRVFTISVESGLHRIALKTSGYLSTFADLFDGLSVQKMEKVSGGFAVFVEMTEAELNGFISFSKSKGWEYLVKGRSI